MPPKSRLDQTLVARGLCPSREQAQRLILAGEVKIGTRIATKASEKVGPDDHLELKEKPRFVSRGGLKLEAALATFPVTVAGIVALDIGASTGGFTDCLLQHGAARVHTFDVGTNQLAWKVRNDPRVLARENFNCRHLTPAEAGPPADLAVMDLSFISLLLVLPAVLTCLRPGASVIALIKPQFELSPDQISKGGIVREPAAHARAVAKIQTWVESQPGLTWAGLMPSPITGTDGNVEFLAWIQLAA